MKKSNYAADIYNVHLALDSLSCTMNCNLIGILMHIDEVPYLFAKSQGRYREDSVYQRVSDMVNRQQEAGAGARIIFVDCDEMAEDMVHIKKACPDDLVLTPLHHNCALILGGFWNNYCDMEQITEAGHRFEELFKNIA